MIGDTERSKPIVEGQQPESNRVGRYRELLFKEATSLLAKYLPEALPQGPTVIGFAIQARYEGRFRGIHYVTTSSEATEELIFKQVRAGFKEDMRKFRKERNSKENRIKEAEDTNEWLRKMREEGEDIPDEAFVNIDEIEDLPDEPEIAADSDPEIDNWDELTGSLNTRQGYSVHTWAAIKTLVHELIHQRQEELNPQLSEELSFPELDQADPKNTASYVMSQLARDASKAQLQTMPEEVKTSMCYVAMEGMAVVGSSYVMKRLEDDLIKAGETESAAKINKVRKDRIHEDTTNIYRRLKTGKTQPSDYQANYLEGVKLMRKLYKRFGETTPKLLAQVNLQACQQIMKGSPQYQQIMEDPTLLPGLPRAA